MCTSRSGHGPNRALRRYLAASAACAAFSAVYESFSHGVYSPFMVGLFLVPLVVGALPAHVVRRAGVAVPYVARQLWAAGVLALALGACLAGVLEIYGTTSPLLAAYPWAGGTLLLASLLSWGAAAGVARRGTP